MEYRFQPVHSYSHPDTLALDSSEAEIHNFFLKLASSDEAYINMKPGFTLGGAKVPNFEKRKHTRIAYKETHDFWVAENAVRVCDHLQLVGIVRNPLDVIDSWFRNPSEFDPDWNIEDEWWSAPKKNGQYPGNLFGLQKWIETTRSLLDLGRHSQRCLLVRYEDLVLNPQEVTSSLFSWLDLPLERQTIQFVSESTSSTEDNDNPYGVYRKQTSPTECRRMLPESIQHQIEAAVRDATLGAFLS